MKFQHESSPTSFQISTEVENKIQDKVENKIHGVMTSISDLLTRFFSVKIAVSEPHKLCPAASIASPNN